MELTRHTPNDTVPAAKAPKAYGWRAIVASVVDIALVVAVLIVTSVTIISFAIATPIVLAVSALLGATGTRSRWRTAKVG